MGYGLLVIAHRELSSLSLKPSHIILSLSNKKKARTLREREKQVSVILVEYSPPVTPLHGFC